MDIVADCPHLRGEGICAVVLFCPFALVTGLSACKIDKTKEMNQK